MLLYLYRALKAHGYIIYRRFRYGHTKTIDWHGANPIRCSHPHRRAAVLLHGDPDHCSVWGPTLQSLEKAGIPAFTETFSYSTSKDPSHDLSMEAQNFAQLDALLGRVHSAFDGDEPVSIVFVGHSMGGIMGARYIWNGKGAPKGISIDGLITLGSRLASTKPTYWHTRFFFNRLIHRIEAFQKAYRENPNKVPLRYAISDRRDILVPLEASQWADQGTIVDYGGHAALPFCPDAIKEVVQWTQGRPAE